MKRVINSSASCGDNRALSFSDECRKKNAKDPYSYPIEWLIRNIFLNELSGMSVSPVGPGTRAHALRVAAAKQDEDVVFYED